VPIFTKKRLSALPLLHFPALDYQTGYPGWHLGHPSPEILMRTVGVYGVFSWCPWVSKMGFYCHHGILVGIFKNSTIFDAPHSCSIIIFVDLRIKRISALPPMGFSLISLVFLDIHCLRFQIEQWVSVDSLFSISRFKRKSGQWRHDPPASLYFSHDFFVSKKRNWRHCGRRN
jgi:hypothetical protein